MIHNLRETISRQDSVCRRFVLTGGPGAGKTTLIDYLAGAGYHTVREAARDIIAQESRAHGTALPWKDLVAFQRRVLDLQLARESAVNAPLVFTDRGIPDGIGYLRIAGLPVLPELEEYGRGRYAGVFLLDLVSKYITDPERLEDHNAALAVHNAVRTAYIDLGYNVIAVPLMPVVERAAFVLRFVNS